MDLSLFSRWENLFILPLKHNIMGKKDRKWQQPKNWKPGSEKLADVNALKQQIIEAFERGKTAQARQKLGYLRKNSADRPDLLAKSLCDLATNYLTDPAEQLALFKEACELNPLDATALNSYGTALAQAGQYDKAFAQFEQSLKVKAENSVTLTSYGTALAQAGQYEKAFAQFEQSLKVNGDSDITLNSYGTALAQAGQYDKAFQQFEQSLKVNALDSVTLTSYGTALAQAERYEESFAQFEQSLKVNAENSVTMGWGCRLIKRIGYSCP